MTRVKVVWNETRLVIPLTSYNNPSSPNIARLLQDISNRFKKHTNDLDDDNYFVELRTDDGFLLDKADLAVDVISDGDVLRPIDYKTWFKKFKGESELNEWLSVTRADFVDDKPKWVQVGYASKGNQIYVEFGTGLYGAQESKKFQIFDEDALSLLLSPSKELINEIKGSNGTDHWYASAHFIVNANGQRSVEVLVKSMSDPRPQIEVVNFGIGTQGKYEKIDSKVIQESFVPPTEKAYKIPHNIVEGPSLKQEGYSTPIDPTKTIIKSWGESAFSLQQTGKVFVEQTWNYKGAFQFFIVEFRLTNSASHPLSIVQIDSEVQGTDGEWRQAITHSGTKQSEYYYDIRSEHDAILTYDAHAVSKLSLRAKYALDYTKYHSLTGGTRRIHTSLPNPCSIRFTIKDQDSGKCQIIVQAFNTGDFISRKSYEQDQRVSLYHWVQCDDVSSEERMYVPIEHKPGWTNQNVLEVWIKPASRKPYIDAGELRKWAFLANKEGKDEYELKDWNWEHESGAYSIKFHALFDKEEMRVYGMKISMKTTTGSVVDGVLFPKDIY